MLQVVAYDQVFSGILEEIDVYRLMFLLDVLNVVYFDNNMSRDDKMFPSEMIMKIFLITLNV